MSPRRPFHRTDRLAQQIKEVLARVLQQETREELLYRVVLTDVEVTRDLSVARVFYYAPEDADPLALAQALARATSFLRRRLGQEIRARIIPELRFAVDASVVQGRRVEEILGVLGLSGGGEPEDDSGAEDDG